MSKVHFMRGYVTKEEFEQDDSLRDWVMNHFENTNLAQNHWNYLNSVRCLSELDLAFKGEIELSHEHAVSHVSDRMWDLRKSGKITLETRLG